MSKKALVIGSHVSESLSPLIFNYWFKKHNIDASYNFKEIKPENFENEIEKIFNDKDVCGFNVTIPFKEIIKKKISFLDEHSNKIGAVNCVSKVNNNWVGQNTDWVGFSKSIERVINSCKTKKAIVIGYGGVSKAIIYSLKKNGFSEIKIYNRTASKIPNELKKITIGLEDLSKQMDFSDIIINTTPTDVLKKINFSKENKAIFAYDVVYKPKETDFLSHFNPDQRIYGISMLVQQASPCFERWFGIKPIINKEIYDVLDKEITT
jgi:shikimate dehydrogenase